MVYLPHDTALEEATLGACILSLRASKVLADTYDPNWFFDPQCNLMARSIALSVRRGSPSQEYAGLTRTVAEIYEEKKPFDYARTHGFIARLGGIKAGMPCRIEWYLGQLRDIYHSRILTKGLLDAQKTLSRNTPNSLKETLKELRTLLDTLP